MRLRPTYLLLLLLAASAAVCSAESSATTAKPKADATTTKPAAGATTAKPAAGATTTKPAAGATTTKPKTTTPEESNVDPTAVAVPEKQCFFPFWFNNTWQHVCMKYSDSGSWCSLTKNFTLDEDWKMCHANDENRLKCKIPFEYEGKNHTKCLPLPKKGGNAEEGAHYGYFCGCVPKLKKLVPHSQDWAYCETENATDEKFLLTPEATPGKAKSSGKSASQAKNAPVKSISGTNNAGGSSVAAIGSQATVGLTVGAVCAVLAVLAVIAAFAVRRRRRRRKGNSLLPDNSSEQGTYGGTQ